MKWGWVFAVVVAGAAQAQEIPDNILSNQTEAPPVRGADRSLSVKAFVDVAPQSNVWREPGVVPIPGSLDRSRWAGWSSLDARLDARPADGVSLILSDRLDQTYADSHSPSTHDLRNTLREVYAGLSLTEEWFFDVGRINNKDGVATGFNPTDFFKKQAVLIRQNSDPAALRDVRLGVFMARVQRVWDGGAVTALVAPALVDGNGALRDQVFNLGLDRTNRDNRFLLKGSLRVVEDWVPEVLLHLDGKHSPIFGANVTHGFGDRLVTWGEWSAGRRGDVVSEALAEGVRTSLFPSTTSAPIGHDGFQAIRHQGVLGGSLSFENKLTLTAEWHYNQQGLTPSEWHSWFGQSSAKAALLWQMRSFAQDAGEPMSRNQVFSRADWTDFLIKDLEVSGFTVLNPADGSVFVQMEGAYYLDPRTTLGLRASTSLGAHTSEWGSVPQAYGVTARLVRYF